MRRSSDVTIFDRLRVGERLRWTHSPAKESRVMSKMETTATIIVKPRPSEGWIVVTPRLHSEIYLHGRQRALQFARAYANLHRPARLRVLDEAGNVESEEIFAHTLRDSGHASRGRRS
jgi:hypothetical protein